MSDSVIKIDSFVLFGALGDLSVRKLIPAWYYLERDDMLNDGLQILGVGRQVLTKPQFHEKVKDALTTYVSAEYLDANIISKLISRFDYCCCDLQSSNNYQELSSKINEWSKPVAYYLAISPNLFEVVFDGLNSEQIITSSCRIIVEKPIGYDLESSKEINAKLLKYFDESQIYRIDHYLGKETVQNLIALRFANSLFSSQWNSKSVDYVEITAAESVGIEDRWGYFDGMGQLRDMVQSHLLQLLCLITMEPPNELSNQSIRSEKVKVLEALKPLNQDNIKSNFVSGQYTAGDNKAGYLNELGSDEQSDTETFVSIKAEIQNWRWKDVPFYLRTGKRMKSKTTQIVIHFKSDGHYIFDQDRESLKGNTLIISLHPTESISLQVFTKPHGVDKHSTLRSDPMSLDFIKTQKLLNIPSGYQSLLMDILNGNQSLFLCKEEVELAWQWCDNALEAHKKSKQELYFYPAGTDGPKESELLIQNNGHNWHEEK
ncbi:glucose-6-phosphate dehydrogenase [Candidatus Pseudothioglobus sp. Uisw_050_01]|uniref:glucose-6-phosphate dehydrogenase n=1 Tax=Candidatus Pseudothioglobus sp. Uisw_050_01 TaxID=3230997 RepID=UPI003A88B61B